jgi:anti-sigma regulatory factor (Ser/Thr protein kinase)
MQEIRLDATVDNIEVATDFVNAELERMSCPEEIVYQIDIAVDELFSNIARYGYDAEGGPVTVRVQRAEAPSGVIITLIDRGLPYNPLNAEAPNLALNPRKRPRGGLGIYMVKKSMDGIEYIHEDGCNKLSIRKNF